MYEIFVEDMKLGDVHESDGDQGLRVLHNLSQIAIPIAFRNFVVDVDNEHR